MDTEAPRFYSSLPKIIDPQSNTSGFARLLRSLDRCKDLFWVLFILYSQLNICHSLHLGQALNPFGSVNNGKDLTEGRLCTAITASGALGRGLRHGQECWCFRRPSLGVQNDGRVGIMRRWEFSMNNRTRSLSQLHTSSNSGSDICLGQTASINSINGPSGTSSGRR